MQAFTPVIRAAGNQANLALLPGQNAEDLCQDVMVHLCADECRVLKSFDPSQASMSTWLFVIARNLVIDRHRKQDVLKHSQDIDDLELKIDQSSLLDKRLWLNRGSLTSREQLVLRLLFEHDLDVQHAAQVLDVEPQTIRSTKHNAIKKLRKLSELGGT